MEASDVPEQSRHLDKPPVAVSVSSVEGVQRLTVAGAPGTDPGRGPAGARPSPPAQRPCVAGTNSRRRPRETRAQPPLTIVLERLPPEILLTILSHLDAASLLRLSHVNKLFRRLANDDFVWREVYVADFWREVWRPRETENSAAAAEAQERPPGGWKQEYLWRMGGQELSKLRKEARHFDPKTGLPLYIARTIRRMNTSWEVTLRDESGKEATLQLSVVSVFKTSVTLSWSGSHLVGHPRVRDLRLCAVLKDGAWRSLVCQTDSVARPTARFLGCDQLVRAIFFPPAFAVGFWRHDYSVAFVMVSLHLDKLLERSLLGSPFSSYWEPDERLGADLRMRSYALHLSLHNGSSTIMSAYFQNLRCASAQGGLLELRPIKRGNLSQHRQLVGDICIRWKSEGLRGSLENCCVLSLTVLGDAYKPLWCVSTPVRVSCADPWGNGPDDYLDGQELLLSHRDARGLLRMTLVWLEEQGQMFAVSLAVRVFP